MQDIIVVAKKRAEALAVTNVVVATITGASVEHALQVFGEGYRFFAVGNPTSAHQKGLVVHKGVSEETCQRLESRGIAVILQDQSLFQAIGIGGQPVRIGDKYFDIGGRCFEGVTSIV